jgi:hypothetical protein
MGDEATASSRPHGKGPESRASHPAAFFPLVKGNADGLAGSGGIFPGADHDPLWDRDHNPAAPARIKVDIDQVGRHHVSDQRHAAGGGALAPHRLKIATLAPLLLLAACAQQVASTVKPGAPGFLLGLWHGFIFPVAFILSLFMKDVAVYAVPNDGLLYNLGFLIGIVIFGIGSRKTKIVYRRPTRTVQVRELRDEAEA